MHTTILIIQLLLAGAFFASGLIILVFKHKLQSKLSWLNEYSTGIVNTICLAKIAGAIGILVPLLTGFMPYWSVLASIGIAVLMVFASAYHIKHREYKDLPATILFLVLAVIVAYYKGTGLAIF